jgi:Carboxypeptidase regulatory-like domain
LKVFAQNAGTTGQVQGTVFVSDSNGRAYVANATVILNGPATLQTETDEDGRFTFAQLPRGTYTIEASFPGLDATQMLSVETGSTAQISLELKASEVRDSVTVTADASETNTPSPSDTITSTTVRNAPNKDERAESLLPLVPGVVRGPDGRINHSM